MIMGPTSPAHNHDLRTCVAGPRTWFYMVVPTMSRCMAERIGFEPMIRFNPYAGLANRCLQPLGQRSMI